MKSWKGWSRVELNLKSALEPFNWPKRSDDPSPGLPNLACFAPCQSVSPKIFHFTEIRKGRMCRPSRFIKRGDLESSFSRAGLAVDAAALARDGTGGAGSPCESETRVQTNGAARLRLAGKFPASSTGPGKLRRHGGPCVRQNRVVLAVVATVKPDRRCARAQPGRRHHPIRTARRPERTRLPGEHGISRPTIAQGRPSVRHHLYAAVRFFLRVSFAQQTAGASRHPAFPAPS